MPASATAIAHPNIALVKYWGKQDKPGNFPATPSLSITLDTLQTRTTVAVAAKDGIVLNGEQTADKKISGWLTGLRETLDVPPLQITTENNFPTGAGLASSASGFAALAVAVNEVAALDLTPAQVSDLARRGSASAARSIFGGYVALLPPLWQSQQTAPAGHWPLSVVVAVCSDDKKAVGSTEGMERSRTTSAYYASWRDTTQDDFADVSEAVDRRDFAALSRSAERSCLKMHGLMLSSEPALAYWNPTTVAAMDCVRALREQDVAVFFTIDAGPQVKAVCLPEEEDRVDHALSQVPGVLRTLRCRLGEGARLVS